jgi:hypothetical protein
MKFHFPFLRKRSKKENIRNVNVRKGGEDRGR